MKITVPKRLDTYQDKVIVVDKKNKAVDAAGIDLQSFMKSDENYFEFRSMDHSVFLVKKGKTAEEDRKNGAKVWKDLNKKVKSLAIIGDNETVYNLLEGLILSSYSFDKYLTKKDKKEIGEVAVALSKSEVEEITNTAKAVFWARDMVNEPYSYLTAEQLSNEINDLASVSDLKVKVLEKTQIESLKMGGLLAVNQGSLDPPTFTIVEYKPKKAVNKKPLVFVGKGVVYDTGGLSLKPTPNSMDIMKCDMGGAASVVGAAYLCALQKLPVHVIVLVPATDNRPGLNAYAPGDIVTMYNGTTVEVLNTDAEGRMILADALAYSSKYDPELVIDAATLTGAAERAIGVHACISMGNAQEKWFKMLTSSGDEVHERVVRFPFWDDYMEEMKSPIADLKNIGGGTAGMITAGKFLEHFVKAPYIHLDIAGPAWLDKSDAYRTRGGSGFGVRLLYKFLKNRAND